MTSVNDQPSHGEGRIRLPVTASSRFSIIALLAVALALISYTPAVPSSLAAILLIMFVGAGPGCAILAWTGPLGVSRILIVPAFGLALIIILTSAAATLGWWSPSGILSILALATTWSVIPKVRSLVTDMVP